MPGSVMVSVPTFDKSLKAMCAESIGNAIEFAECHSEIDRIVHRHVCGYGVANARNMIAQAAIDEGVDYVWMVDSDIVVPQDALSNMLDNDVDVCMGWYVRGESDNWMTCAIELGSNGFSKSLHAAELRNKEELVRVKGNGFGCALVSTNLFRRLPKPWFKFVDHVDGSALGEDYWFCQQCANAKVPLYVDTRVACGHIHDRLLSPM